MAGAAGAAGAAGVADGVSPAAALADAPAAAAPAPAAPATAAAAPTTAAAAAAAAGGTAAVEAADGAMAGEWGGDVGIDAAAAAPPPPSADASAQMLGALNTLHEQLAESRRNEQQAVAARQRLEEEMATLGGQVESLRGSLEELGAAASRAKEKEAREREAAAAAEANKKMRLDPEVLREVTTIRREWLQASADAAREQALKGESQAAAAVLKGELALAEEYARQQRSVVDQQQRMAVKAQARQPWIEPSEADSPPLRRSWQEPATVCAPLVVIAVAVVVCDNDPRRPPLCVCLRLWLPLL